MQRPNLLNIDLVIANGPIHADITADYSATVSIKVTTNNPYLVLSYLNDAVANVSTNTSIFSQYNATQYIAAGYFFAVPFNATFASNWSAYSYPIEYPDEVNEADGEGGLTLSVPVIVGIAVGGACVLCVVLLLVGVCYRRAKAKLPSVANSARVDRTDVIDRGEESGPAQEDTQEAQLEMQGL